MGPAVEEAPQDRGFGGMSNPVLWGDRACGIIIGLAGQCDWRPVLLSDPEEWFSDKPDIGFSRLREDARD